jgi:AcrR family transcriptional regulator
MPTQDQRNQATRSALIAAGRALFAQRGYADVSVGELARGAGVTTGALYHQFDSKQGLFKAVYDELVDGVWARIVGARESSAQSSLIADCEAYLDACADASFHRITADGPAVIGWDELLDGVQSMIAESLTAAHDRGEIADVAIAPLARMLAAALKEAGVIIATAEDPAAARVQASESALYLVRGLLASDRHR